MNQTKTPDSLIEVRNLKKYFPVRDAFGLSLSRQLRAVDDVSFDIRKGETFGLVGESGCGKTTLGRCITRLYDFTAGDVRFEGRSIAFLHGRQLKPYHRRMQVIFQNPFSSLDPTFTVRELVEEPLRIHMKLTAPERAEKVRAILAKVGIAGEDMEKFPYELSGGQCQRVGIARALVVTPAFVLCDEPISALDVSVQAQVVNLLEDIQQEMGLTYLFIAHDLSMVRHISRRIGVMYLGRIVELASGEELYTHPLHPYTRALLSSVPVPDPKTARETKMQVLSGDPPSPVDLPPCCRFCTRCPLAEAKCRASEPELRDVGGGHFVACHLEG